MAAAAVEEDGAAAAADNDPVGGARYWQALLAAECPPGKSRVLHEELGSLPESAALRRLASHPQLTVAERRRLEFTYPSALDAAMRRGVIVVPAEAYPPVLKQAEAMPPALFFDGDPDVLAMPTVAIVGTRAASTYGKACARKFAEALARAGVTVVSGGALGIDAAAHRGALEAGGKTVAVLASGVDHVYPAVHHGLFDQIRRQGALTSQFAIGSKPSDYRFLMRNGLIAAMSRAVLVVEAPRRSGAIRTAHDANELGREVFVVPANIDNLSFQGSFSLIRDGATLVSHPSEILEALGIAPAPSLADPAPPSGPGEMILAVLTSHPLAPERIVEQTGLDTADVLSELTLLELDGLIIRDSGGYALKP